MKIDPNDESAQNCTPDTAADFQDLEDTESPYKDDVPMFVDWPWPRAALVALVRSTLADLSMSPYSRFIFLSPTTSGLAALEKSEYSVEGLWLIYSHLANVGDMTALRIEQITRWRTGSDNEQLTVLRCSENRLIGIDDKSIFDFKKTSTDWSGSGPYKRVDESEN